MKRTLESADTEQTVAALHALGEATIRFQQDQTRSYTETVRQMIQPVRAWLQRLANRLVYGVPADPYALLAELSKTPAAGNPDRALAQIAEAVARGIGSGRARVILLLPGGNTRTAVWPAGETGPFGQTLAVTYGGEIVGEIGADESGGQRLTEALTAQAGHALHTLRLAAELDARLA